MEELSRDPAADPRLAAALRNLDPPPAGEVDWERLRASLRARAELPLARRRRTARLRTAARWARVVVPAAAAAGLALAVQTRALRPVGGPQSSGRVAGDIGAGRPALVDEVVYASYPAQEVDRLISGRAEADALLLAAVGEEPARL
ncbi:MAG TPA: hypothetical protein VHG28_00140 [Longimicrobiaceae bacterium]|nr:hypothetical protein [Longimicrobiaceae bacterium]